MERLTERNNGANRINCNNCGAKGNCIIPNTCLCEITDRLAAYEDAEEQGLSVRLPCKVGDMVYYRRGRDILGDTVERIIIDGIDNQVIVGAHKVFMFWDFGRNVFTSREEAEVVLNEGRAR